MQKITNKSDLGLQKITNKSKLELTLEVKTLDRTKGNVYIPLDLGSSVEVEDKQISDQTRALARDKITRPALLSIEKIEKTGKSEELVDDPESDLDDNNNSSSSSNNDDDDVATMNPLNNDADDLFVCDICDREFETERGLSVHSRVHEDDEDDE